MNKYIKEQREAKRKLKRNFFREGMIIEDRWLEKEAQNKAKKLSTSDNCIVKNSKV
jgi:hypothetical protein